MNNKYKSLKDHVYEYISKLISKGKLKPNEKINEKQISEEMNVSSTPVREALIQLTNEGVLKQVPRKGFLVKDFSVDKVEEVYQIIGVLESLAIETGLKYIDEEDILELKKLCDKMDIAIKYKEYEEYYELQTKFHETYISLSKNEKLKETLESLKKHFIRKSYSDDQSEEEIFEALKETNLEHKKIIELI